MFKSQLALRIAGNDDSLSKGQKTFNRQVQQIEKLRSRLAAWEIASTTCQKKYTRELVPQLESASELQIRLVLGLDCAEQQKGLTHAQRRTLRELIVDLAGSILVDREDEELKTIYDRHCDTDFDSEKEEQLLAVKSVFEEVFGFDLGDEPGLDSPEELMRRAQTQFEKQQASADAELQAREERRASRKKSARQLEKEARLEEASAQINQSIRAIYRKLASALHPDRETDPEERVRKTELMQRINQAYDRQNLLQLLELQLELEHIDRAAISRIDEKSLQHYNAILKRQVAELKEELMRVEMRFRAQFRISPFSDLKPETAVHVLDRDIQSLKRSNREMEQDLRALETPKGVKAWLKELRRRPSAFDFDDMLF